MASVFRRLFRGLIDRCPSSKRSIRDLRAQVGDLQTRLTRMQEILDGQLVHILENQRMLHVDMLTNREHSSLLGWSNYRRDNESDLDARKRFYYSLPKATGSVRLIQRGCASLLSEFAEIAREHNLQYWADFGTLLGVVRHRGFIPWDDDVDLGMIREDIDTLLNLLQNDEELSKRYRAVLVFDPYVCCRQLRLRYKNPENPSFIDIFFYDYLPEYNEQIRRRFIDIRKTLQDDLRSQPFYDEWLKGGYREDGAKFTREIESIFTKYRKIAQNENIISKSSTNETYGVIYGIDNVDAESIYMVSCKNMFPLNQDQFEDFSVCVPNDAQKILYSYYGNIYQLPADMFSHFQHVSRDCLENQCIINAIEEDIATNPYATK